MANSVPEEGVQSLKRYRQLSLLNAANKRRTAGDDTIIHDIMLYIVLRINLVYNNKVLIINRLTFLDLIFLI